MNKLIQIFRQGRAIQKMALGGSRFATYSASNAPSQSDVEMRGWKQFGANNDMDYYEFTNALRASVGLSPTYDTTNSTPSSNDNNSSTQTPSTENSESPTQTPTTETPQPTQESPTEQTTPQQTTPSVSTTKTSTSTKTSATKTSTTRSKLTDEELIAKANKFIASDYNFKFTSVAQIKAFQRSLGVADDGNVGPTTGDAYRKKKSAGYVLQTNGEMKLDQASNSLTTSSITPSHNKGVYTNSNQSTKQMKYADGNDILEGDIIIKNNQYYRVNSDGSTTPCKITNDIIDGKNVTVARWKDQRGKMVTTPLREDDKRRMNVRGPNSQGQKETFTVKQNGRTDTFYKENGVYYRRNSNGTTTRLRRDSKGNFYWTQADGTRLYLTFKNGKAEVYQQSKKEHWDVQKPQNYKSVKFDSSKITSGSHKVSSSLMQNAIKNRGKYFTTPSGLRMYSYPSGGLYILLPSGYWQRCVVG